MTTIKDIQQKILDKIEQKYKGGVSRERLARIFGDQDKDSDGFVTLPQFKEALSQGGGNPISEAEAEFLFHFYDTLAETQEPQGGVEVLMVAQDLAAAVPAYSTGFNSGAEGIKSNKGAKGNQPSQVRGGSRDPRRARSRPRSRLSPLPTPFFFRHAPVHRSHAS